MPSPIQRQLKQLRGSLKHCIYLWTNNALKEFVTFAPADSGGLSKLAAGRSVRSAGRTSTFTSLTWIECTKKINTLLIHHHILHPKSLVAATPISICKVSNALAGLEGAEHRFSS
jgi:hypothetical protein